LVVSHREPDGKKADTIQAVVLIGDEVRIWRMRRAMTQAELAEKAGVGVNTIVRIERNQTGPRPPTIRKLAEALRIDTSELVQ
jgi:transcriptional regulator with XRE-family HTH domain